MTKIGAIDDKTKNVTTPNNNNKDVAKTDKYAANTRLLTVFDVDDRKGYLSEKERAYYQEFLNSPDFYVNIYDENGNKIRYVEDLDAGNYLVYDFKDGKRITSTVFNAETGDEKRTEFIFDADGNEIGMRETNNRSKTQDVNVEYNENNKPVKVTQTYYSFDENNNITGVNEFVVTIEYDENGNEINRTETETHRDYIENDKKLDIKS